VKKTPLTYQFSLSKASYEIVNLDIAVWLELRVFGGRAVNQAIELSYQTFVKPKLYDLPEKGVAASGSRT
jgi:hypothetical protein